MIPFGGGAATGSGLTPEQKRAWNAMEWAQMHGEDLAGALRLDPDDDAEALQAIDDALLAAGDYWYAAQSLDRLRADQERHLDLLERAEPYLGPRGAKVRGSRVEPLLTEIREDLGAGS